MSARNSRAAKAARRAARTTQGRSDAVATIAACTQCNRRTIVTIDDRICQRCWEPIIEWNARCIVAGIRAALADRTTAADDGELARDLRVHATPADGEPAEVHVGELTEDQATRLLRAVRGESIGERLTACGEALSDAFPKLVTGTFGSDTEEVPA